MYIFAYDEYFVWRNRYNRRKHIYHNAFRLKNPGKLHTRCPEYALAKKTNELALKSGVKIKPESCEFRSIQSMPCTNFLTKGIRSKRRSFTCIFQAVESLSIRSFVIVTDCLQAQTVKIKCLKVTTCSKSCSLKTVYTILLLWRTVFISVSIHCCYAWKQIWFVAMLNCLY
jgi:hypothetical protein